jgi:hypothetical protein
MQSEILSQSFIWGVLAFRFQSELELQKRRIWRLSGLLREYGEPADGDLYREQELMALIEVLTGLLVLAVIQEAQSRQLSNRQGRRAGRPKDVITPYLAPELLSVFRRYNDRAGRQSIIIPIDGKQKEAGRLLQFIDTIIQPLNQYLTTELHRSSLSASRLARYALDNRRRIAQGLKPSEAKASAKKPAVATKHRLPPGVIAFRRAFALPE